MRKVIEQLDIFNLILRADSYKIGHSAMYPSGTEEVYSFIESRGGKFDEIVVMGVDSFVDRFLTKPLTDSDVDELVSFFEVRPEPFNEALFRDLVKRHGGFLPVKIKSLPEGTVVPVSIPMVSVVNTSPEAYWVTSMIETVLLSYVWYMSSVATLAREIKKKLKAANERTAPEFGGIDFQLHNFGDRGAAPDNAGIFGGVAHMVSFMGSDSIGATRYVQTNYKGNKVHAFSVPASEHSVSTAWGSGEGEKNYILNTIRKLKDKFDIISIVADTFNVYEFVRLCGTDEDIKQELESLRAVGKKLVFRPDSGDVSEVLPKILSIIEDTIGGVTVNSVGYKVLPPHIGILWGDGVNFESIDQILSAQSENGWASSNVVMGMGGQLVHAGVNRDTQKFAMKGSNAIINGESRGIVKNPITAAWKKSKAGKFSIIIDDGKYTIVNDADVDGDLMTVNYENGWCKGFDDFAEVKARAVI